MKQIIYIFVIIILCSCNQQEEERSDLIEQNIRGQVAVIMEESYFAKENYGIAEPVRKYLTSIEKYNLDGNSLYFHGNFLGRISSNEERMYDNEGLLNSLKKIEDYGRDSPHNVETLTKYEYDDNKRLIKSSSYNPNGELESSYEYNYNKSGRIKSHIEKYYKREIPPVGPEEGTIVIGSISGIDSINVEYEYNKQNRISKLTYITSDEVLISSFEYDKRENIIKEVVKSKETITRKFDNYKNVIFDETIEESGETNTHMYKYEYDNNGNWTKRTTLDSFLQPISITLRKIEYYSFDPKSKEIDRIKEAQQLALEKEYEIDRRKESYCTEDFAVDVLAYELSKIGWELVDKDYEVRNLKGCLFEIDYYAKNRELHISKGGPYRATISYNPEDNTYAYKLFIQ